MKNGDILNKETISGGEEVAEILFDHYFDNKKADEPNIEIAYKKFCHSLLDVDPFQIDEIMSTAAVLCMEHERAGFIAGIKKRIQIEHELAE